MASIAIKRYNLMMGAVDEFNKMLAASRMHMGRCKQRWQRACFLSWLLPAVGLNNVRTAFCEIIRLVWGEGELKGLQKSRGVASTGFATWFQLKLGKLLVVKGINDATRENGGAEPHFLPMRRATHWERPLVLPAGDGQDVVHRGERVNLLLEPRAIVIAYDKSTRKPCKWLGGGSLTDGGKGRCEACLVRCHNKGLPQRMASQSRWACKACKVILCRYCWHQWDHSAGGRAPPHVISPPRPRQQPKTLTPQKRSLGETRAAPRTKRHRPNSPAEAEAPPRQTQPKRRKSALATARADQKAARAREGKSKAKQARRERVAAARRKRVEAAKPAKSSGKQSKKRKRDSDGSGPNGSGAKRTRGK